MSTADADIIYLQRSSARPPVNIDAVPCADQIDMLRGALAAPQVYIDDTRRLVRVDMSTGAPQIVAIEQAVLTEIAARLYDWVRPGKGGPRQVVPPAPVVRAVLADPGDLPRLRRVVDVPYMTSSGRVVDRVGYDPETETYLHLDREIDPIPDHPTDEQLADAIQLVVRDALDGFVFADAASKANAIASVITWYLRQLYPELLAPISLIDAKDNNWGKTTLAQSLVVPLVGQSPEVTQMMTTDRVECRRTIYSLLRDRPTAIIIDNLALTLAGDAIASVLTSRRTRDRQIRSSTAPSVENNALWYVTGTLMTTSRELGIRSVLTQLVAPPVGNRDPIQWAVDHRIEIVRAHLIIIRRWIADGRNVDPSVRHPKYQRWAELTGGVLQTMGVADLLANQHRLATRDDETAAWMDLVDRWSTTLPGGPAQHRRVGEIVAGAAISGEPAWDLVADGRDLDARKKILGHALRRRDGVVVGTWRIRAAPNTHAKVHEYWLDPVAQATTAPTSAPSSSSPSSAPPRRAPARNPAGSTAGNDTGNGSICGVCGVSACTIASHTRARAPAREAPAGPQNPANPAAQARSIADATGDWASTSDESIAADPASLLARVVRRERGGRS